MPTGQSALKKITGSDAVLVLLPALGAFADAATTFHRALVSVSPESLPMDSTHTAGQLFTLVQAPLPDPAFLDRLMAALPSVGIGLTVLTQIPWALRKCANTTTAILLAGAAVAFSMCGLFIPFLYFSHQDTGVSPTLVTTFLLPTFLVSLAVSSLKSLVRARRLQRKNEQLEADLAGLV